MTRRTPDASARPTPRGDLARLLEAFPALATLAGTVPRPVIVESVFEAEVSGPQKSRIRKPRAGSRELGARSWEQGGRRRGRLSRD